jgi:hypothetical protein
MTSLPRKREDNITPTSDIVLVQGDMWVCPWIFFWCKERYNREMRIAMWNVLSQNMAGEKAMAT